MDAEPLVIVKRLIDAFSHHDTTTIASLLHEDIVCAGMPLPKVVGKAQTLEFLAPFLAAEQMDWQLHASAVSGRFVHTERTDRFQFRGRGWTEVRAAGIFEVAQNGQIIAWRDYFDLAELLSALPPEGRADV